MPIDISILTEADIPSAIDSIQLAFADDPYNRWVFNDRAAVTLPDYLLPLAWLSRQYPVSRSKPDAF